MKKDTIAAIATALSDSGIGIVRVSGPEAVDVCNRIFVSASGKHVLSDVASHTLHYGFIVNFDYNDGIHNDTNREFVEENDNYIQVKDKDSWKEQIIDEVMVAVMLAPRSYTTEDTVEINCHGGVLIVQKVLEQVLQAGARMAEPGEFTKRAFLNGRMDLSRAEAVIDVIHSQNEYALKSSVKQLKGDLSKEIRSLREAIIYEIAFIESALDDPEHISLDGYIERLGEKVDDLLSRLDKLIATADNGKLIKEGIDTVIIGKPNAGKSSLLNRMVGDERAIVTDIAGTTRDILTETIKLRGIGLNMIDTAGIRSTEDVVEKIGVERAKKYAADADLVIYVVDASVELDENDYEILDLIQNKKTIILLNKSDLDMKVDEEAFLRLISEKVSDFHRDGIQKNINIIKTSTKENIGMEEFEQAIEDLFFKGTIKSSNEVVITNLRHKEALINARESLAQVQKSLELDLPEDFYSIDLMSAYASLGYIIGEEVDDDLVTEIFSKFCLGK